MEPESRAEQCLWIGLSLMFTVPLMVLLLMYATALGREWEEQCISKCPVADHGCEAQCKEKIL